MEEEITFICNRIDPTRENISISNNLLSCLGCELSVYIYAVTKQYNEQVHKKAVDKKGFVKINHEKIMRTFYFSKHVLARNKKQTRDLGIIDNAYKGGSNREYIRVNKNAMLALLNIIDNNYVMAMLEEYTNLPKRIEILRLIIDIVVMAFSENTLEIKKQRETKKCIKALILYMVDTGVLPDLNPSESKEDRKQIMGIVNFVLQGLQINRRYSNMGPNLTPEPVIYKKSCRQKNPVILGDKLKTGTIYSKKTKSLVVPLNYMVISNNYWEEDSVKLIEKLHKSVKITIFACLDIYINTNILYFNITNNYCKINRKICETKKQEVVLTKNQEVMPTRKPKAKQDPKYSTLAKKLAEIIGTHQKRKIPANQQNSWGEHIRRLCGDYNDDVARIEKALDWYAENIGEKYVPVILSGVSLRTKFPNLESAIERDGGGNKLITGLTKKQIRAKYSNLKCTIVNPDGTFSEGRTPDKT